MTAVAPSPPADLVLTETHGSVAVARIHRPDKLNALNPELMNRLAELFEGWERDPSVHVIVLTGGPRAFAAGADIGDMAEQSAMSMYERDQFHGWDRIRRITKPIVASVSGFALGGGCELMMMCDVVIAGEGAKLGQPEINLGVIPGAGGTQRLTRAIGKARAMDLILTGRMITAAEALDMGLVSRVVPDEHAESEALKIAAEIAAKAPLALRFAKEAVNKAYEGTLADGVDHERKLFYLLFASEDQKEGMRAFADKRRPAFTGR